MAITPSDFSKIWASNADTPEYTFSDANYQKGWDFVGNLPPTRAQWNAMQKSTDEKMKYVFDNFGAPLTASTVAEMTMRNRVYVYTGSETGYTAGHWYYWNGSAWTNGGVYNSNTVQVDPTLTISGAAADARATGGYVHNLFSNDYVDINLTPTAGYVSASTGEITSSSAHKYSQLVEVWEGAEISANVNASGSVFTVAMYDENGAIVMANCAKGRSAVQALTTVVRNGTRYIRLSCNASHDWSLRIKQKLNQKADNAVSDVVENQYPYIATLETPLLQGYLSGTGEFIAGGNFRTTDFIPIIPGEEYAVNIQINGNAVNARDVVEYDAEKTYIRKTQNTQTFYTYATSRYVRIDFATFGDYSTFEVYPTKRTNNVMELNKGLVVPQADAVANKRLDDFHARRPVISFMLDAIYDMNDDFLTLLENHGYRGAVAVKYGGINYGYENLYKTRNWKYRGHEILVHGSVIIDSSYTPQQADETIRAAYTTLVELGITPHGYIASNGSMYDPYKIYTKKYYSWAATVANRSGSNTPYFTFNGTNLYEMWRYSMQLSTLAEQEAAVDSAIANNGFLFFYAHAKSDSLENFTLENFDALLTYIDNKVANYECSVKTPTEAITDYFAVRQEDMIVS